MINARLLTQGRWLDCKEAIPGKTGIYQVLTSASESTFYYTVMPFDELASRWVARGGGFAREDEVLAWYLPDAETVRLQDVINRAREILDSVPAEWPEVSPGDTELYDHLEAIRKATAVLEESSRPDPTTDTTGRFHV